MYGCADGFMFRESHLEGLKCLFFLLDAQSAVLSSDQGPLK